MERAIMYTTDCPKCRILKSVLEANGISYVEEHDVEKMMNMNISLVPVLEVNGELMNFTDAIQWARKQGTNE